jgi:hypothetical protein
MGAILSCTNGAQNCTGEVRDGAAEMSATKEYLLTNGGGVAARQRFARC